MVYQVTRHGARCGIYTDYFQEKSPWWRKGELTQNGKRQQYLIGEEVRERYMVKNKLLDEARYNPKEIMVRSTDINRTIESAMAQMLSLYPTGYSLELNQTAKALPILAVDQDIKDQVTKEMDRVALPHNYFPVPVHVQNWMNDIFQATDSCPIVAAERKRRQSAPEINDILMKEHKDLVRELATLVGKDPDTFDAFDAAKYMDDLWARWFE